MDSSRLPRKMIDTDNLFVEESRYFEKKRCAVVNGERLAGRQKLRWRDNIMEDIKLLDIKRTAVPTLAKIRTSWRAIARESLPINGRSG